MGAKDGKRPLTVHRTVAATEHLGLRLQRERIQHCGRPAIEPAKYQAIDLAKDHPLRRSMAQNIELVTENERTDETRRARPSGRGMTSAVEFPVSTSILDAAI